jgi:hypothetical protein
MRHDVGRAESNPLGACHKLNDRSVLCLTMSTYDPNPPVGPIGYQPVEFLDIPLMRENLGDVGALDRAGTRLDARVRSALARSVRRYIAGLVERYDGDSEDVRSIIHDLDAEGG